MPEAGVVHHIIRVCRRPVTSAYPDEQTFSVSVMSQLIGLSIAPKPMNMPGLGRHMFDRYALDAALDACSKGAA
jgi:hypothetical protein